MYAFSWRSREEIKTILERGEAWRSRRRKETCEGWFGGVQSGPLAARLIFHKFEKHTRGSRCVNLNFSAPVRQSRVFLEGKEAAWKGHWAYGAEFRTTFFPPFFILPVVGNTRLAEMPFLLLIGDFQSSCFGSCCYSSMKKFIKEITKKSLMGKKLKLRRYKHIM